MEALFGSFAILIKISLFILWILVPIFIFLISKRVKEMRDMARESKFAVKELNANIKYLKRKLYEEKDEQDGSTL
ncbi:hypothetical protein ACI7YQ_10520 [Alteromonas marina]